MAATEDKQQRDPSGQDLQSKFTLAGGLNKSSDKLALDDKEYTHLKNGFPSSENMDEPFIQNAPSNKLCCDLPEGFFVINKPVFVKERKLNILCILNPITKESEIGYFYFEKCVYEKIINNEGLNFNINYPIKGTYKINDCNLTFYFQDGFNPDRRINLDKIPYKKEVDATGCVITSLPLELEIGQINIQNDLLPPVVKITNVEETGALYSGAYQFAVAYSNSVGNELSSYYSKTNIVPIYKDSVNLGWKGVEGSDSNVLTSKSIILSFENLDTRYDYINIAVIKTIQGSPAYEMVATIPTGSKSYTYTGRETTKFLTVDQLMGLYPDYINSKTLTSGNNYLIRANLSTQDEGNFQRLANLIELGWAVTRIKADDISQSYKNPLTTTNKTSVQRGEVYPYGLRLLFTNGKKSNVYHIASRKANTGDLELITSGDCNNYELTEFANTCDEQEVSAIPNWKINDTSEITFTTSGDDECEEGIYVSGEFAYWESTDKYPCDKEVWGDLAGEPIRHHKFPSNETFHIQNQPYNPGSANINTYNSKDIYLYPMGVALKDSLENYITKAISLGYINQEEGDIIAGYEIVRGSREGQKSVIAKGLLYNMFSYLEQGIDNSGLTVNFPNYPFNDLREDPYLNNSGNNTSVMDPIELDVSGQSYNTYDTVAPGNTLSSGDKYYLWDNPYDVIFTLDQNIITNDLPFQVQYSTKIDFNLGTGSLYKKLYVLTVTVFNEEEETTEYELSVSEDLEDTDSIRNPSKTLYTFHSPDTSFKKPFLGTYLKNHVISYGTAKQQFQSVEGHPCIKPHSLRDCMNHAVSSKAEGNYNSWIPVPPEYRRRKIEQTGYLNGNSLTALEENDIIVNNLTRESSVALELHCIIPYPEEINSNVEDQSKVTMSSGDKCSCKDISDKAKKNRRSSYSLNETCTVAYRPISSYYSSLNIKIPNQYGNIFAIKYVSTGKYLTREDSSKNNTIIFGGDTFITRFSVKRNTGFFDVDFINQSAYGVDYTNAALGATPNYYLRNTGGMGKYVIDKKKSKLDCSVEKINRNGWVYLYNIGIANFFVESEVNTELRHSGENIWQKWYPSLKSTSFRKWTEQLYNPIIEDNYYLYNWNYSKQNTEEALFTPAPDYAPNTKCKNTHPRRIIYSKQANEEESSDSWQVYPANQYYDVDSYLGDILDVQSLDTQQILVRCENGSAIFNAYDTLELDKTIVTVGTGGMFSQRPQTFGNTDNGYGGSSSKYAMDITPMGVFYTDIERGQVFMYQGKLAPISDQRMSQWFHKNLPIKFLGLIKDLPNFNKLNKDNPFYGFGLQSIYDTKYKLWFLTKKDYLLVDPLDINFITITPEGELLYKENIIDFNDTIIFKEISWTISYSPLLQKWFSFHSFYPNYTMYGDDEFFTGLNKVSEEDLNSTIYKHWDKSSFQTYYGKLFPFEITLTTGQPGIISILHSIEYELRNYKVINEENQDLFFTHLFNFNKAIISTDNQSSGKLLLNPKNKNNPFESIDYPKINNTNLSDLKIDTLYSKVEGNKYRLNQFFDIVEDKNNNLPIFINDENGVDRYPVNLEYDKVNNELLRTQKLRNSWFDVTLIQDESSEYKMVFNLLLNKTLKSIK